MPPQKLTVCRCRSCALKQSTQGIGFPTTLPLRYRTQTSHGFCPLKCEQRTLRPPFSFLLPAKFLFRFSSLEPSVLTKIIIDRLLAELEAKTEAKQALPICISGESAKCGTTVVSDSNKTPRNILEHLGVFSAYSVAGLGSHSGQAMRLHVSP